MEIHMYGTDFCLSRDQGLYIIDGCGHRIVCKSGSIWITQYGYTTDFFLQQNESLTLATNAKVCIAAIRHATFAVEAAEQRRARFALEVIRAAFRWTRANLIHRRFAA